MVFSNMFLLILRKILLLALGKLLFFEYFTNLTEYIISPVPFKIHEKLKGKKAVIFAIPGKRNDHIKEGQ